MNETILLMNVFNDLYTEKFFEGDRQYIQSEFAKLKKFAADVYTNLESILESIWESILKPILVVKRFNTFYEKTLLPS